MFRHSSADANYSAGRAWNLASMTPQQAQQTQQQQQQQQQQQLTLSLTQPTQTQPTQTLRDGYLPY
jgi:hypothetical protein